MTNIWEDKIYSKGLHTNRYPFDRVVSRVLREKNNLEKPLTALDLGSGTGNHLKFFLENGFRASGIEQSESAIKAAKKFLDRYSLEAEIINGNIIKPKEYFPNRKFSVILDRGSLTHNPLEQLEMGLKDIESLLGEGGIFLSYIFSQKHPSVEGAKEISKNFYSEYTKGVFSKAEVPALFLDEKTIIKVFGKFDIVELVELNNTNVFSPLESSSMYEIVCKKRGGE